jgi:hypothetical protein
MGSIRAAVVSVALLSTFFAPPAQAIPVSGQGNWETTLQARDIDGNGSIDAYYDTQLNITWLANFNINGKMNWDTANTWATTTSFFGLSGWRLPATNDTGTPGCNFAYSGTDCGYNVQTSTDNPVNSEMAHLFYVTLGNKGLFEPNGLNGGPSGLTNSANLVDVQRAVYWSGTVYSTDALRAWDFRIENGFDAGFQGASDRRFSFYAVAVRPGDVGASLPLPPTVVLMLLMFGSMGLIRCRRPAYG